MAENNPDTPKTSTSIPGADPRYTLTEEELEHVLLLKQECDKEGVEYRSIFELSKYSLVASSISDPKKRLKESFARIKKKREFEAKHKLERFNFKECLKILEMEMPNWIQVCSKVNGKWCVGYDGSDVDGKYLSRVPDGFEIICVVEMLRYDLAAADLEEARQGFYIVSAGKVLKGNPINHARMMMRLRVLFDKMNANRVKGIFFEAPSALSWLFGMVLKVMPAKLRERIKVGSSLDSLEITENVPLPMEALSLRLGGEFKTEAEKWFEARMKYYEETEKRVVL